MFWVFQNHGSIREQDGPAAGDEIEACLQIRDEKRVGVRIR
jgi:hypothetical protein